MTSTNFYYEIDDQINSLLIKVHNFLPSVLYIKRIKRDCGNYIYYFGKTSSIENVYDYTGSGTIWLKYVSKYGKNKIETVWVSSIYLDSIEIQKIALRFSIENDIINSNSWANIEYENGVTGGLWFLNEESKTKKSLSLSKTLNSDEWKNSKGIEKKNKRISTYSSKEWKEGTGLMLKEKRKNTIKSEEWQKNKKPIYLSKLKQSFDELKKSERWDEINKKRSKSVSDTTKQLTNRPIVIILRKLQKQLNLKFGKNWSRKSDAYLQSLLDELLDEYNINQECCQ